MVQDHSIKHFLTDDPPTIVPLSIKPHFEALSDKQKLYAHYLSIACFAGFRALLRQVSSESEDIYDLLIALHKHCNGDWKSLSQSQGVAGDELKYVLNYAAQFLGNGGNYKSFGDSKFVPRLAVERFEALASCSVETRGLFHKCKSGIYDVDGGKAMLGYPGAGHTSTYYPESPDINKDEITAVSDLLEKNELLPENTRVRKLELGDFEVLISCSESSPDVEDRDVKTLGFNLPAPYSGRKVTIVFGDNSKEMIKVAEALKQAQRYVSSSAESKMIAEYIKSFTTGSMQAYLQSQKHWIKDKGPVVETDIGFIETYRDPHGIRGEWEGFVAMVNQERTRAFGRLVEGAPEMIPKLPWGKEFEKDEFLSPDFTSLEVLTFCGSGIPAGINIPNFDSIRQTDGFKNVSLNNVLSATPSTEPTPPFISPDDSSLYLRTRDAAFELQVGLHELLGHGCGKLLQETSPEIYNFDIKNPPLNLLTGDNVKSWYKPGQTWSSVFGSLAGPYEECRAELVAMALCCDPSVLSVFGFEEAPPSKEWKDSMMPGHAGDIVFSSYLSMARSGIAALEFWDPKSRRWGQPHMQARFSILQTFLAAGQGFCRLEHVEDNGKLVDLCVRIDRGNVLDVGRPAVERYLLELGLCKATADFERGKSVFEGKTEVDEWWAEKVRPLVLEKRMPRKVFVQANTVVEGVCVGLKEYDVTPAGMIRSFAEREYI